MKNNSKIVLSILLTLACLQSVDAQQYQKRSRGEGLYQCVNANTVGHLNIWTSLRAIGFIWDNPFDREKQKEIETVVQNNIFGFPELSAEIGFFNIASLIVDTRALTYGFRYGSYGFGAKFTWPNNKDIRAHGPGLLIKYEHQLVNSTPTLGGYIGFMPEGYIAGGGNLRLTALYNLDALALFSKLPLSLFVNTGINLPLDQQYRKYSTYRINTGIAFIGLGADFFIEYSLEAFFGTIGEPKLITQAKPAYRKFEVAFSENKMYLTLGARIRYDNGLVLYGAAPLLISRNWGSAMTNDDKYKLQQKLDFSNEDARGVTDPFDPWYAKWKIVGSISFPLRFRQTGAEMRRSFLLMKNRKDRKRINIDERLNKLKMNNESGLTPQQEDQDKKRRLGTIRKRRDEIVNDDKDK
ncbi:MAG: hypothetical protein GF398_21475 [Chitinivibrionales bacterium]|nr:hypothetical protein [Chitinivibrionales bacterium]